MSADFINGIGSRSPASLYGVGPARGPGGAGAAKETGNAPQEAPAAGAAEGFAPTTEVAESKQDTQAGEAAASQFSAAWSSGGAQQVPSAGQLQVQGAENTTINQVHGVKDGQHVGTGGAEAGFSAPTVYSSRPPGG